MTAFKLGFLTHVHGPDKDLTTVLRELLDVFAAGELGFDENPVRLAEDALVLDALSGGRVQLGLGSGTPSAAEFAAFGRDAGRRHADYDRNLAFLSETLAGHDLSGRLWDSTLRREALAHGARAGHGLLLGVGPADQVQAGLADAHLAVATGKPRIAAVRGVFPGPDKETAAAELAPDVARYLSHHVSAGWAPHENIGVHELLRLMNVRYGTPDQIIESLRVDPVFAGPGTHLIAAVQAESSTLAQALRRLEVLANEIAPEPAHTRRSTPQRSTLQRSTLRRTSSPVRSCTRACRAVGGDGVGPHRRLPRAVSRCYGGRRRSTGVHSGLEHLGSPAGVHCGPAVRDVRRAGRAWTCRGWPTHALHQCHTSAGQRTSSWSVPARWAP